MWTPPLYSKKPSFLNLFMKNDTRERVVPIKAPRPIRLARAYGHPSAQFVSCTACPVVKFMRWDSLSGRCTAGWNGFEATEG